MYYFYYCHSHVATVVWIIVSFAYKLILQVVAIYFAFKTRKVKIKPLNDSKEIAAIIYITSLILVASVGAAFALGHLYLNAFAAVLGGGRLVIASIILALIFIPKVSYLMSIYLLQPWKMYIGSIGHGSICYLSVSMEVLILINQELRMFVLCCCAGLHTLQS